SWIVCWHVLGGAVLGVPFCLHAFGALLRTKDGTNRQDVLNGYSALGILCYISGIALLVWAALGNSTGRLPVVFAVHIWSGIAAIVLAIIGSGTFRSRDRIKHLIAEKGFATSGLVLVILA